MSESVKTKAIPEYLMGQAEQTSLGLKGRLLGAISSPRIFQVICLLFFLFVLKLAFFDYEYHWAQPENYNYSLKSALRDGPGLHLSSFIAALDTPNFNDGSRGRQLSFLFQILNGKFQAWVFNNIGPHPTASLNWFFVLGLSPIFFFLFLRNLIGSSGPAWGGLAVYTASAGYLSSVFLSFHPGKPIGNCFMILCLYVASKIWLQLKASKEFQREQFHWFSLLLGLMFLSFFLDEVTWFVGIAIPVLFPSLFLVGKHRLLRVVSFSSTFAVYLGIQIFAMPKIVKALNLTPFDFLGANIATNEGLAKLNLIDFIDKLSKNAGNLFHSQTALRAEPGWLFYLNVITLIAFLLAILVLDRPQRDIFIRSCLVLALFTVFQVMLLTRHMGVIISTFYYGCMFSVFFAVVVANLFAIKFSRLLILLQGGLVVILISSFLHFRDVNGGWKWGHQWLIKTWFPRLAEGLRQEVPSERENIIRIWKQIHAGADPRDFRDQLGTQEIWMILLPLLSQGETLEY